MKKITCILLLASVLQHGFSQTKDIEIIRELNKSWLDAYSKKDSAALDRIFAEDFLLISPKGAKMTRADVIGNLSKQDIIGVTIDSADIKSLTTDVAILTAYITFVFKADGKEMKGKNCYQDIYVKRKERWFAVAAHVTVLGVQ